MLRFCKFIQIHHQLYPSMIRVDACHFVTIIPRTDKSFTCVIGEIQSNQMIPSSGKRKNEEQEKNQVSQSDVSQKVYN